MILEEEQARRFYALWIPLLDFVNHKYRIDKRLYGMRSTKEAPIVAIEKIRDKLWANPLLIDAYVRANPHQLEDSDLQIISQWEHAVTDDFIVLRHLKSGSIFIPMQQDDAAYIVRGLFSTWEEMMRGAGLPQIVHTTLIPFEGKITYDGIIRSCRIQFGGNLKRQLNDSYREIKAAGHVYKSFPL